MGAAAFPDAPDQHCNGFPAGAEAGATAEPSKRPAPWRPLVLLIPLRLGLTDINEAYVETLKVGCPECSQQGLELEGLPTSCHLSASGVLA